MSRRIAVRPDWPHFAGHFAGRPILPGIAHLGLVREELRLAVGADLELVAVSGLRLRRVVTPGDELDLEVAPRGEGEWSFELRCGGEVASRGRVTAGAAWVPPTGAQRTEVASGPWPALQELVPHRGPALLLAEVVDASEDRLVATAVVPPTSPFAAAGVAPPLVALEVAAQAAAAWEALWRRRQGGDAEPRVGYLVGAREAALPVALPVGAAVRATVWLDAAVPPLSTYRFEVDAGGGVVATGVVSTYLDVSEFAQMQQGIVG